MPEQQPKTTTELNALDRNWIRHGLNVARQSLIRSVNNERTSDNVREALRKDIRSLDETIAKFS